MVVIVYDVVGWVRQSLLEIDTRFTNPLYCHFQLPEQRQREMEQNFQAGIARLLHAFRSRCRPTSAGSQDYWRAAMGPEVSLNNFSINIL
jgi:hypothetical protein